MVTLNIWESVTNSIRHVYPIYKSQFTENYSDLPTEIMYILLQGTCSYFSLKWQLRVELPLFNSSDSKIFVTRTKDGPGCIICDLAIKYSDWCEKINKKNKSTIVDLNNSF
jgi:hypothetical protein